MSRKTNQPTVKIELTAEQQEQLRQATGQKIAVLELPAEDHVIAWQEVSLRIEDVFRELPVLETKHLLFRKMGLRDTENFFEFASDPRVIANLAWEPHRCIEDSERWIAEVMERYAKGEVAPWAVEHKTDRKLIGMAGFVYWLPGHARAEVMGMGSPKYWGRRYGIEALREMLAFGFGPMRLNRIEGLCKADNAPAAALMQQCGMQLEGTLREYAFDRGAYHDIRLYSILRRDWREDTPSPLSPAGRSSA